MLHIEAAKKILLSTEDTYNELLKRLEELTSVNEEKLLLKELSKEFDELKVLYINSEIFGFDSVNGRHLNFNYKKGIDDVGVSHFGLLQEEATFNWLSRKRRELERISLVYSRYKKYKKDKFETIDNTLNVAQLKRLFKFLTKKENQFIIDTDFKEFSDVFSANEINYQPKIKWVKGIKFYAYFFYLLNYCEFIDLKKDEISSKLNHGQFFINYNEETKNSKSFYELSKMKKIDRIKRENEITNFMSRGKKIDFKKSENRYDFESLAGLIKSLS